MFRQIKARLVVALWCACSLAGCSSADGTQDGEVSPLSAGYALAAAGDLAIAAAQAAGMQLVPMPGTGCSTSILEPAKVLELLMALPEAQRTALATVLDASAGVWTAQLYRGDQGVGMCLPVHQMLVVLPPSATATVDQMAAAIEDGVALPAPTN